MRVQNEGTGKSSWWMINPDAKPGKAARRRAISMETQQFEKRRGRAKRKVDQIRQMRSQLQQQQQQRAEGGGSELGSAGSLLGAGTPKQYNSTSSINLSNLTISESGLNSQLGTSPPSTENFDLYADYHNRSSNSFTTDEFRSRAISSTSTCSAVLSSNMLLEPGDSLQVIILIF